MNLIEDKIKGYYISKDTNFIFFLHRLVDLGPINNQQITSF